jgi:hypothetical protein
MCVRFAVAMEHPGQPIFVWRAMAQLLGGAASEEVSSTIAAQVNREHYMSTTSAELAAEYWKLIRAMERTIPFLPDDMRPRLAAQCRYANGRIETLLGREGMRLVSFDGSFYEVNMPATAVNGEEMAGVVSVVVERTLEPAVVSDHGVVLTGKVFLAAGQQQQ